MSDGAAVADCLFCRILAGEEEASVVYEDERWFAFMDLRQVNGGHCLLIPRRHVRNVLDLDDDTGTGLARALRLVANAVRAAFQSEGVSIWQSNEPPWQEVFHLHFHLSPRVRGDGMFRVYDGLPPNTDRAELEIQAARIRETLAAPSPRS